MCSAPDDAVAQTLATALIERRLAACVNLLPTTRSVYRWQGKIEMTNETPMLIKTTVARYPALEAALRTLHPYTLPEIIALPLVAGLAGYLDWVQAETTVESA